jgi:hypothetical protein
MGQAEIGWLGDNCMAFVLERAVQYDRTLLNQILGKMTVNRAVLSYEEAEAPSCPLVVGYAYRCWQSGGGHYEVKNNGCAVIRVPSVDWLNNGGAFPSRLPYMPEHQHQVGRIDSRHCYVTSTVSWQLSSPSPPLGVGAGFGLLLSGGPSLARANSARQHRVRV